MDVSVTLTSFGQVTGADLVTIIRSMKIKSNKLDILPHWLMKDTFQVLMPLYVCFVNCVLKNGLPLEYKHAVITPLLKNASLEKEDLKNYRPVSNFPTLVKIIEKTVANKLLQHLDRNRLMDPYQSAYRNHYSCETAVLSVLNDIYMAMDQKEISIAALLDMSAAFDTVDHGLLITKLEERGIKDDALNWLRMYLCDRAYSTQIREHKSNPLPLKMSVPQGSVLGPLLFTIYIRQLGEVIDETGVRYNIYADDTQLLVHTNPSQLSSVFLRISHCINEILNWTSHNFLQLNSSKTEFIIFGTREQLRRIDVNELTVNNQSFPIQMVVRNLGILLDSQLKFSKHVDNICRAAYGNLRMLQRVRSSLSNDQFSVLAHALVLSRIEYAPSVLYGVDKCELKKLQRVIKAAFRYTFRYRRRDKISEVMRERGWLSIDQRITLRLLLILHTAIKTGKPDYLSKLVTLSSSQFGLRSQTRGDLHSHRSITKIGSRSLMIAAPKVWGCQKVGYS